MMSGKPKFFLASFGEIISIISVLGLDFFISNDAPPEAGVIFMRFFYLWFGRGPATVMHVLKNTRKIIIGHLPPFLVIVLKNPEQSMPIFPPFWNFHIPLFSTSGIEKGNNKALKVAVQPCGIEGQIPQLPMIGQATVTFWSCVQSIRQYPSLFCELGDSSSSFPNCRNGIRGKGDLHLELVRYEERAAFTTLINLFIKEYVNFTGCLIIGASKAESPGHNESVRVAAFGPIFDPEIVFGLQPVQHNAGREPFLHRFWRRIGRLCRRRFDQLHHCLRGGTEVTRGGGGGGGGGGLTVGGIGHRSPKCMRIKVQMSPGESPPYMTRRIAS